MHPRLAGRGPGALGSITKAFRTAQIWGEELEWVCGRDSLAAAGAGLGKDHLLSKATS